MVNIGTSSSATTELRLSSAAQQTSQWEIMCRSRENEPRMKTNRTHKDVQLKRQKPNHKTQYLALLCLDFHQTDRDHYSVRNAQPISSSRNTKRRQPKQTKPNQTKPNQIKSNQRMVPQTTQGEEEGQRK